MEKSEEIINQQLIYDDSEISIEHNNALMREAISDGNLNEVIKSSSELLKELRNTALNFKDYYIICKLINHNSHEDF